MHPDLMRAVDFWVGVPLTFLLSMLRRVKRLILPTTAPAAPPRHILFVQLAEMGTMIVAYPALRKARELFPDATLKRVYTPAGDHGTWEIVMRQPAERFNVSHTYTQVWIDRYSGAVLHSTDPRRFNGGTALMSYRLSFHNGEAFGLPGKLFVSALGVVLAALWVTGVLQWWRRRQLRRRGDHLVVARVEEARFVERLALLHAGGVRRVGVVEAVGVQLPREDGV